MAVLDKIDKAAAAKGKGVETFWQFVKFIFVSLGACLVQTTLTAILPYIFQALYDDPCKFFIFDYSAAEGGWGYFWVFAISNVAAQVVAFFINKEKTFNSSANVAITLPIFLVCTVVILTTSQWAAPVIKEFSMNYLNAKTSEFIAMAVTMTFQFLAYFPVNKILFRKKKEDK